jgi:hypothetical protein
MRRLVLVVSALAWSAVMWACGGDDLTYGPSDAAQDVAPRDVTIPDATDGGADSAGDVTLGDGAGDGGAGDATGDAGDAGPLQRLLLSYNGATQSELVAFGTASKAVDGRYVYPAFIGTSYVTADSPWLLEQSNDVVAKLDPMQPWKVDSSWSVALADGPDAAGAYADPDAVVVGAGTKAYVLRYTRNEIAVIDPTQVVDGGAPTKTIDLSGQVQAAGDGIVEMTAGVYVASKSRVYVLLGNINRGNVGCGGFCLLCAATQPTIVAIDVTTDTIVPLNGADAGAGYALGGYNPAFGQGAMAYDAQNDRLLVLHAGCNQQGADGGVGPLVRREVEEVPLATGVGQQLLDLTSAAYPQQLVYIDGHDAIVQLDTAYHWDPTQSTLGAAIPNAPDAFAYDGAGNLLGVKSRLDADGGFLGYDVVSVRASDGMLTKLGADPFSLTGGFISGAQLWPAP